MATLKMPQLGESVTEGTIAKWLKQPGDKINKYDPLAEVITDKVNAEVPSEFVGTLTEILVPEGATVAVGTPIATIAEEGEAPAPAAAPAAAAPTPVAPAAAAAAVPAPAATAATAPAGADRPRYSPAVMRLLQENNVDPSLIAGTGTGGRITRKDVLSFVEQGGAAAVPAAATLTKTEEDMASLSSPVKPATGLTDLGAHGVQHAVASAPAPAASSAPAYQAAEGDQVIEATGIRKTIARRMVESKHNAPHAWTMMEVDMTSLVRFRDRNKEGFKKKEGVNLTFLPFMIKAVVDAIKQYPIINSTWQDDKIIIKKDINISIAVATDDALFVPVIKNADRLSILGLSHAINDLAKRARAGKLTPNDMSGGTFTVNNTGAFGSVQSMPIINAPQAAILSMESIIKRPHVMPDDSFAIRSMMNMCMSLDHRVLDGWVCGQFLQAVKKNLESATEPTLY